MSKSEVKYPPLKRPYYSRAGYDLNKSVGLFIFCSRWVVLGYAAVDSSVFVLLGFIQNVPPLLAANGRCACLCINQGAVNLPFNRRGSHAGNYFGICKSAERTGEKDAGQGGGQRWSHKTGRYRIKQSFFFVSNNMSNFQLSFLSIYTGHGLKLALL